jgi:demethylmenaquinone methyltransferase/2-methoxy-6-polyprenyl-1,4-benzoquinol methylase
MFARIARRYDLMNRIMTGGQDAVWRRQVIHRNGLPANGLLLDLGAGTGDLGREALSQYPACRSLAADFTLEMMQVGKQRIRDGDLIGQRLDWAAADADLLPFPEGVFDAVVSGFLLRNLSRLSQSLSEQYRVLKPGGRIVTLDTTPPPASPLAPLIHFHMHTVIPALGRIIAGHADAYRYLPDSTEGFLQPERLAARLLKAGFEQVGFQRLMFGTIAIHWGRKPLIRK